MEHTFTQFFRFTALLLFLISISYIIHLINFSNVQKLPYFSNVECDDT